jgi:hypothetical protein
MRCLRRANSVQEMPLADEPYPSTRVHEIDRLCCPGTMIDLTLNIHHESIMYGSCSSLYCLRYNSSSRTVSKHWGKRSRNSITVDVSATWKRTSSFEQFGHKCLECIKQRKVLPLTLNHIFCSLYCLLSFLITPGRFLFLNWTSLVFVLCFSVDNSVLFDYFKGDANKLYRLHHAAAKFIYV